jgi:hypothetical protein
VGVSGAVFLFWLGLLVAMGSETMYIKYESKTDALIALWFAAFVIFLKRGYRKGIRNKSFRGF